MKTILELREEAIKKDKNPEFYLYQKLEKTNKRLEDYKSRTKKAIELIKQIFKDENWYKYYEYNDLEYALKEVAIILYGRK